MKQKLFTWFVRSLPRRVLGGIFKLRFGIKSSLSTTEDRLRRYHIFPIQQKRNGIRQVIFVSSVSLLLTSCATLCNRSSKSITIYTTEPSQIIYQQDTVETTKNKAQLKVERRKEMLPIVAKTDSITKTILLKPRNSFMFWFNIPSNYAFGMLIDRKNPKRYSYPDKVYLNSGDSTSRYYTVGRPNNKGELYLHLSLPHINSFCLKPINEDTKTNTGFWGFSFGLDYYHTKNQFIHLGASGVMDFFLPFPAAVDISGEYELMKSTFVSLSNNHAFRRLSIGYGISFAKNFWNFTDHGDIYSYNENEETIPPAKKESVSKRNFAAGFIFPAYLRLSELFHLGVVYRPTFYRPDLPNKFAYEHLISVDFAWKIRLKK